MDYMGQVSMFITSNLQYVILLLTAMIFIALIIFVNINVKLGRLSRRYQKLMEGMDGTNIENLLMQHIREVRDTVQKVDELKKECVRLNEVTRVCIQNVGIVRFNAFDDTGSDLSFAIALLDDSKNGVVVSSIFGRSESRTYAKPVKNGQSDYFLTEEEKQAIAKAGQRE